MKGSAIMLRDPCRRSYRCSRGSTNERSPVQVPWGLTFSLRFALDRCDLWAEGSLKGLSDHLASLLGRNVTAAGQLRVQQRQKLYSGGARLHKACSDSLDRGLSYFCQDCRLCEPSIELMGADLTIFERPNFK